MAMQIKRRHGAGAPTGADLLDGQLAYHKDTGHEDLYVGDGTNAVALVSSARQVEIAGSQNITGQKTFTTNSFHLTGGNNGDILAMDNAANGTVHWTPAPGGGLLAVATDATLSGNGADVPLHVVRLGTARNIGLQGGTNATTGAITTITSTAASFDGSANVTISAINISLDDGQY